MTTCRRAAATLVAVAIGLASTFAAARGAAPLQAIVDAAIVPLMQHDGIPGMAVAVVADGRVSVFDYGIASRATRRPVDDDTLFEIGSISKTLTATLASDAQVRGELSWADPTRRYLPSLAGTPFGDVPLAALATHTAGGFPLQVPDGIVDDRQLMAYFAAWRPTAPVDTVRVYANPGIGMLGRIVAVRAGRPYARLLAERVLQPLGMTHTFVDVPSAWTARYAQGYTKDGRPIRLSAGPLSAETYGVRTTAADLARFVQANLGRAAIAAPLQQAIDATHVGRFTVGPMTQALIWERYPWPVGLDALLEGNGPDIAFAARPVVRIDPSPPDASSWIDKTGSTNGFGAFVAFIPTEGLGVVLLANRNVPIADRVTTAYRIVTAIEARRR